MGIKCDAPVSLMEMPYLGGEKNAKSKNQKPEAKK